VLCPLSYGGGGGKELGRQLPEVIASSRDQSTEGGRWAIPSPRTGSRRHSPCLSGNGWRIPRVDSLRCWTRPSPPSAAGEGDGIDDSGVAEEVDHLATPSLGRRPIDVQRTLDSVVDGLGVPAEDGQPSEVSGTFRNRAEVRVQDQRLRSRSVVQLASAIQPPSTGSVTPLTKALDAGSARKAIAAATSSGAAKRPIGTRSTMSVST
jgi:hypothetical protein